MLWIIQRTILCLFCVYFVTGYFTREISALESNVNNAKTTEMNSEKKLKFSCDCGNGICNWRNGKMTCKCFPNSALLNGKCVECGDCGANGKCGFNEKEQRICRCVRGASENNGTCEECDCGIGTCSFVEGNKTCECPPKHSVLDGICKECDCGNGTCSFVEGYKTCDCPPKYSELDGTCKECDCGIGTCSFVEGDKTCDCPPKYSELDGICKECDCGEGTCSFVEGEKTCYCPDKFVEIDGKCEVEEYHPCDDSDPCKNGGECIKNGKSFICKCESGFTGSDCSETVWCQQYGQKVCGNMPCKYNPSSNTSFCECGGNMYFYAKFKECTEISECLKLKLEGKCLAPHESCLRGNCTCERNYEYTEKNETCVRKNLCTDETKKNACSALCIEDSNASNGYKCICDDGYVLNNSNNVTSCNYKCNLESNKYKCLHTLGLCELDSKYNAKCSCPLFHIKGPNRICNKMAEYSFVGIFEVLKKPYEVFNYPDMLTSFVDYTKLAKDFNEAFSSVFKFYKKSNLNCTENSKNLYCSVELQLTKEPGGEIDLIFTPSVCLPMTNSEYCLIPPNLILRNKQSKVFKKTEPCDDMILSSLCGETTTCQVSENKRDFQCRCKDGFTPTGAYHPFPVNSESVVQKCMDVNECLEEKACPKSTYCNNTIGSYECNCREGFRRNANLDTKTEGCVEICNPNPCIHGSCKLTGTDAFMCNCEPAYTGLICDEENLLISDIQASTRKNSYIIGGTLGTLLVIVVFICISLIRRNRKKDMDEERKTFEVHRRQFAKSQQERQGARECAEDNMGISYERSHSNGNILYNATSNSSSTVPKEIEAYNRTDDSNDPVPNQDKSQYLDMNLDSYDVPYYTTMPSGVDAGHSSKLGRSNTEVESKLGKKHNDVRYIKKSIPIDECDGFVKEGEQSTSFSFSHSVEEVSNGESKVDQFSVAAGYGGDKVEKKKKNKVRRASKDIKKWSSIQRQTDEVKEMQINKEYEEDEIIL